MPPKVACEVASAGCFATDKNTFLGREAVQWTADRKIREIAFGDFWLYNRRLKVQRFIPMKI